ncbi:uncharacterized protein LOC116463408 [Hylobates moloch]|uniref:uncharacterized protein LOC116463408 n=1 Tax=Hylobates moloch TaxID=81572 RepID=UPI002674B61F|nr:uncharacterized protein LOC116463408 [Hylobates moloch]
MGSSSISSLQSLISETSIATGRQLLPFESHLGRPGPQNSARVSQCSRWHLAAISPPGSLCSSETCVWKEWAPPGILHSLAFVSCLSPLECKLQRNCIPSAWLRRPRASWHTRPGTRMGARKFQDLTLERPGPGGCQEVSITPASAKSRERRLCHAQEPEMQLQGQREPEHLASHGRCLLTTTTLDVAPAHGD